MIQTRDTSNQAAKNLRPTAQPLGSALVLVKYPILHVNPLNAGDNYGSFS